MTWLLCCAGAATVWQNYPIHVLENTILQTTLNFLGPEMLLSFDGYLIAEMEKAADELTMGSSVWATGQN